MPTNSTSPDKPASPFSFKEQLKVSRKGELLFLKKWPHPVTKLEGKGPDFMDTEGRVIELKTDTYDIRKTENFFMEVWSVAPREGKPGKPGGPWQAASKGCTCFVYLFLTNKTWFIFEDVPALLTTLDKLRENNKYLVAVRNAGYTTLGLKVKRSDLAGLYREVKL